MSAQRSSPHGQWSSGLIFILAVTGAAVGLGNVWKFPYLAGASGGGAFLLVYALCLAVLAFPLLVAEILMGRRGRLSPVGTWSAVATEEGRLPSWQLVGWLGLVASLLLLATYSVVGSWSMAYVFRAATGMFADLDSIQAAEIFQSFISDPEKLLAWHTMFVGLMVMLVARGVREGLEEAVRWFMPALLGLLLLLAGYIGAATGFLDRALAYMFTPDFDKITSRTVMLALAHAFYSLSLGMGVVMTYSAYLGERVPIMRTAGIILVADTVISVLAGLIVFPVVFSSDLTAASGPALTFQVLPLAFGQMPNGTWFGTLFFLLMIFTAWTSAIALMEPAVAHLVERRGMQRPFAASLVGLVVWVVGVVALLSLNVWDHLRPLKEFEPLRNRGLFDLFSFAASNLLMPIGGLLLALFVGWRLSAKSAELELGAGRMYRVWRLLIRYVTPVLLVMVMFGALGFEVWTSG